MSPRPDKKDLVVLVPDADIENAMTGLPSCGKPLGTRPIRHTPLRHPQRDPGCYHHGHDLLRPLARQNRFALLVFDREGCGAREPDRETIEAQVEGRLARNGWEGRAAAVVIDPEIEAWVWSGSPHVAVELGWKSRASDLRSLPRREGLLEDGAAKPTRPEEAMERALRVARRPRSSARFRALAEKVGLKRCDDPAFLKLTATLRRWFPPE